MKLSATSVRYEIYRRVRQTAEGIWVATLIVLEDNSAAIKEIPLQEAYRTSGYSCRLIDEGHIHASCALLTLTRCTTMYTIAIFG